MYTVQYRREGISHPTTIGGAARLSTAKEIAEANAGKALRWYKNADGSQRAFANSRTYIVYDLNIPVVK